MNSYWRPGSLSFLAVLLVLSWIVAPLGCWLGFRNSHLEGQGVDIVQHSYLLRCAALPGEWNEANLGEMTPYPDGSYYPAVALLPLFDNQHLLALRAAASIAVLWMLAAQYTLLCRLFRPWPALAVLLLWQALCLFGKVADINHICEATFNYSRVVGGASLWLMLAFLTTPETIRWRRLLWQSLAVLAASYAILSHMAPGAIAFATLGVFGALQWRHQRRDSIQLFILTTVAGCGLVLTGDRFSMMNYVSHPGYFPVGPLWFLLGWVPTWIVAVVREYRALRSEQPTSALEQVLTAALVPSGLFQTYAAWKFLRDASCAPYSVNVLSFYTFSFASLLWFVWAGQVWQRHEAGLYLHFPARMRQLRVYGLPLLIAGLLWLVGSYYGRHDRGFRKQVTLRSSDGGVAQRVTLKEGWPLPVTHQLADLGDAYRAQFYYYDPLQVSGSYYATMLGLELPLPQAQRCFRLVHEDNTADALLCEPGIKGVLLPRCTDPREHFHTPIEVQEVGPFWCCRLTR